MNRYKSRSLAERFHDRLPVDRSETACWLWPGKPSAQGYGRIRAGGRGTPALLAHRVAVELFVGPIPAGLTIDHRCHTDSADCPGGDGCLHRRCVNPAHLEAVEPGVNTLRGRGLTVVTFQTDVCQRGHAFTANAYTQPKTGKRQCAACRRVRRSQGAA